MTWEEELDNLIRDVTAAGWMAKSEARARFQSILSSAKNDLRAELVEKMRKLKEIAAKDMKHDLKGSCDFEKINTLNDVIKLIQEESK